MRHLSAKPPQPGHTPNNITDNSVVTGKRGTKNKRGLTARQKCFIAEYLIDLNGTQAAIRAGYNKNSAKVIGCENLTKPDIQAALSEAMQKRAEKTQLTAQSVIDDIAEIKADAKKKTDSGMMVDRTSALKACELLGRHLKMFTDKTEHSGEIDHRALTTIDASSRLIALIDTLFKRQQEQLQGPL